MSAHHLPEQASLARRAALMMLLWLGFWLLAACLVLGLLAIPFAQMAFRDTLEMSGIVAACAGLSLAYALRPRKVEKATAGIVPTPLRRDEVPALFDFIEDIAAKLGVKAPVEVHLVTEATAFISAQRSWNGRVTKLSVGLGLPLFSWLSERELASVIAHEFGHFVGGDVFLSPWVYRTRASIGAAIHSLDDSMFFLDAPFRTYGSCFLRLSGAVSRAQEYSADALGARFYGSEASCAALEKVHLVAPLWSAYFHHDLLPALNCGARLPVFDGFRRFCAATPKRDEVRAAMANDEERSVTPYDSPPSLAERLQALGKGSSSRLPRPASCAALLGSEEHIEALWYERIGALDLPASGRDSFGEAVMRTRIEQRFADTAMAPAAMPLTALPAAAQSLDEWWERLRPDGLSFLSPEGKREYVRAILREWVIANLCASGFAVRVRPGMSTVLDRDAVTLDPAQLLAQACAGTLRVDELAVYAGR